MTMILAPYTFGGLKPESWVSRAWLRNVLHVPGAHRCEFQPAGRQYDLAGLHLVLHPAGKWFADLKRRRRDAWLSYF